VLEGLMLGRMRIPVVMSLAALILVNLVPLAGVLWLGWRMVDILFLFWFENVVIGAANLLRMGVRLVGAAELKGVVLIPFFTLHYFGFCAVHGLALLVLFGWPGPELPSPLAFSGSSVMGLIHRLLQEPALLWALAAVAASHLLSFLVNFFWGGEWRRTTIDALMLAPYARVIVLHLFVVVSAWIVTALGEPIYALVLLVALKTAIDASAHLRERRRLGPSAAA
jgi:hypothetical protein